MGNIWSEYLEALPSYERFRKAFEDITDDLSLTILGRLCDEECVNFEQRHKDGQLLFYVYVTELPEKDEKTGRKVFQIETPLDKVFGDYLEMQGAEAEPEELLAVAEGLERWAAEMRRRATKEG